MKTTLHLSADRGLASHGWLVSRFSFSFADYHDPNKMGYGALRVINDDLIAPAAGFDEHPHQNMEIITIPLEGSLRHQDSAGNQALITTGEIQIMSAGTGVTHSEYNASESEYLKLLQIWIQTQKDGIKPYYAQKSFDPEDFHNHFQTIVSPNKKKGSILIHQEAWLSLGHFETGQEPKYGWHNKNHGLYLFVIEGKIDLEGQLLNRRDALAISEAQGIQLSVIEPAQLLLIEVPLNKN